MFLDALRCGDVERLRWEPPWCWARPEPMGCGWGESPRCNEWK